MHFEVTGDKIFVALGARHTGDEKGLVLPEVEMPPLPFHRVMDRAPLPALRTRKARSGFEIQPQAQPTALDIHLAFDDFPPGPEPECHPEQIVGVHSHKTLHARKRSASPSLRWPKAPHQSSPRTPAAASGAGIGGAQPPAIWFVSSMQFSAEPFFPPFHQPGQEPVCHFL